MPSSIGRPRNCRPAGRPVPASGVRAAGLLHSSSSPPAVVCVSCSTTAPPQSILHVASRAPHQLAAIYTTCPATALNPRTRKAHWHGQCWGAGVGRNQRAVVAIIRVRVFVANSQRGLVPSGVHKCRQAQPVHAVHQAAARLAGVGDRQVTERWAEKHTSTSPARLAGCPHLPACPVPAATHLRLNSCLHGSAQGQPPLHTMPSAFMAGVG